MKKNLKQLTDALKKSGYECEAGYLVNCVEFIELEEKANSTNAYCCLGAEHKCQLNVNGGFCAADTCQYKVKAV